GDQIVSSGAGECPGPAHSGSPPAVRYRARIDVLNARSAAADPRNLTADANVKGEVLRRLGHVLRGKERHISPQHMVDRWCPVQGGQDASAEGTCWRRDRALHFRPRVRLNRMRD